MFSEYQEDPDILDAYSKYLTTMKMSPLAEDKDILSLTTVINNCMMGDRMGASVKTTIISLLRAMAFSYANPNSSIDDKEDTGLLPNLPTLSMEASLSVETSLRALSLLSPDSQKDILSSLIRQNVYLFEINKTLRKKIGI